ncbi:MAG TPA: hypothetical protein IAA29_07405 [Candidatus Paenibacillus intestinavium]|nr:hypothetical protein [Candidatus Paenibacillus intestinavium]
MASEIEKKGKNWFKSVLSNQNQLEKGSAENQELITEFVFNESTKSMEESEQPNTDINKQFFEKNNQDKIVLDVMVSIENMLKERQLLSYKNKGLEEQLNATNETINRFKHDQIKKDQLLQEKQKEIRDLENNLTNKQMSYDQLLEDYKEYQLESNVEYEKISNQLEIEVSKYNKHYEETSKNQYQNMLKVNDLEDKIRSLEIENQKYSEQYQKIVNEKAELMNTINDFTERMSFSFSAKTSTSNPSQSE